MTARIELGIFLLVGVEMFVEALQQIQPAALLLISNAIRRSEVEDGDSGIAQQRALEAGGQETSAPILRAAQDFARIGQHHKAGKVFVDGTKPGAPPGSHDRPALQNRARLNLALQSS